MKNSYTLRENRDSKHPTFWFSRLLDSTIKTNSLSGRSNWKLCWNSFEPPCKLDHPSSSLKSYSASPNVKGFTVIWIRKNFFDILIFHTENIKNMIVQLALNQHQPMRHFLLPTTHYPCTPPISTYLRVVETLQHFEIAFNILCLRIENFDEHLFIYFHDWFPSKEMRNALHN